MKKKFTITGLDCANCAAKLEAKMNELPEVESAVLTFATEQLMIEAEDVDAVLPKLQELAEKMEPGTRISELVRGKKKSQSSHLSHEHHHDHCGCGEDHEHHHHDHCGCGEDHEHHHHDHCGCGEDHEHHHHDHGGCKEGDVHDQEASENKKEMSGEKKELLSISAGAVLFAAGVACEKLFGNYPLFSIALFVASYLILGGVVVLTALRNMTKGKVFDENFLMSLATIGAFIIGEYPEAVGVMLFYRIGELFEDIAVNKSRKQIMEAVDMRPEVVRIEENGQIEEYEPEEVQVGQIMEVRPGDRIPLDGIIVRGESRIDTSAVTGEPVPVAVMPGSPVVSGCVNTSGILYVQVEKSLEESMVTRILEAVENAAASKPKIDRFITKFARVYTPFVVFLAVATAVIPSLITGNWEHWIYTALTFLVISCPCALVLSVPLAFFAGIGAGSKKGILFKGGVSLEMLAQVKAVVMDKTGTVTKGNFKVDRVETEVNVTEEELLSLAASAESRSTHPIAVSIMDEAQARKISAVPADDIQEISGKGMVVQKDGHQILCGNKKLLEIYQVAKETKEQEYGTEVLLARDGKYIGRIVINDTIKEDSAQAVSGMKKQGLWTVMLTGDTQENAKKVAEDVGIQQVFARQMPEEKLENLGKIREERGAVMFIGDGINDAPVLAGADVGAAMGSGADAAIEAADVVFMNSQLTAVNESFQIARKTSRVAMQNVVGALAIKALVMVLGLFGIASMWMAVFADSGVAMLCVINAVRILYTRSRK
ncbi:MAG: cadmium-translocating P-type ATPase [Lachnospiraceae bacterium]|nr:cadmium-translocating P-type ATPase [Lachnospiraceae bacterium]